MCGGPFEQACWLRGYTAFLTDLYAEPAFAEALLEGITELDIGMWDAYLGAIGEHVQVVAQGDDVGMQDREYISPELYRKYIFPRHKRLYDFIHSRTRAKLFMHSCGSIRKLIPYLIEAGVDALNPVQYSAANMDLAELKREFGSELSFWGGGMDTQHALLGPGASLQSIEADVRRNMDILGKGGGFVFSATHNIQHETPPQTTLQVYDTAVKARATGESPLALDARDAEGLQAELLDEAQEVGLSFLDAPEAHADQALLPEDHLAAHLELLVVDAQDRVLQHVARLQLGERRQVPGAHRGPDLADIDQLEDVQLLVQGIAGDQRPFEQRLPRRSGDRCACPRRAACDG